MHRTEWIGALLALTLAAQAQAQGQLQASDPGPNAPVRYDVRFDNAVHHEARISVTYRDLKPGPVTFRMARSSPGRYALHEFAKNVYSVAAADADGKPLTIRRTDPYSWTVPEHRGAVTLTYTLFGDRGDGTYVQIDAAHARLNMPAAMMWASGYDDRPIRVTFHPLDKRWTTATQLQPVAGARDTWWAPNLQYLMDSPTQLADFQWRTWQVTGADGQPSTMRLAVHSPDSAADVDRFAAEAKQVTAQHFKLFGGPPPFDFRTYTFIADYSPEISGDGMEHRNSTMISQPRSLKEADFAQIDTLSHEFFHAWNVERLRPAELEPFDFTRADPTPSLWFAEGFTQYYGPLLIHRAGESTADDYLAGLARTLNAVVSTPGRTYGSPQEMSLRAPFADAATAIDPLNDNTYTSYYPYGATVALALDLTLRERFHGLTLDDYMRRMWRRNGAAQQNYAPATPYTTADLEAGLAELTGDKGFARTFFATAVESNVLPDFAPLLAPAGLVLRPAHPDRGWLGAGEVKEDGGQLMLADVPDPRGPLYAAGADLGDVLVSLNGRPLAATKDWASALAGIKPGESVQLVYRSPAGERTATLKAAVDPTIAIVRLETIGGALTPAQQAFRAAWFVGEPTGAK